MALGLSKAQGIDYAWEHVPIRSLVDYGADFVCRYISNDPAKDESLSEATALANAGIWSALVFETSARRAAGGRGNGTSDALAALARCGTLHVPDDRPVYFAVDYDANPADVVEYFRGVRLVLGTRSGVYGGYRVVRYLFDHGLVDWAWQTYAWSGGQWDSRAQIRQYHNDITVGGVGCDADVATTTDYGQWKPGVSPNIKPDPTPQTEEDDMPNGNLRTGKNAVTEIAVQAGTGKWIGFMTDETLEGLPSPQHLRVAVHDKNGWHVTKDFTVSSAWGQKQIPFPDPASTNGVSIRRTEGSPAKDGDCDAQVAWVVGK